MLQYESSDYTASELGACIMGAFDIPGSGMGFDIGDSSEAHISDGEGKGRDVLSILPPPSNFLRPPWFAHSPADCPAECDVAFYPHWHVKWRERYCGCRSRFRTMPWGKQYERIGCAKHPSVLRSSVTK